MLVSYAHRWHGRLLSSEGESCVEGRCGFGDIRDWGNCWMKEAVRKGDLVMVVVRREVKGGVCGTGCEIWVPTCDLGSDV